MKRKHAAPRCRYRAGLKVMLHDNRMKPTTILLTAATIAALALPLLSGCGGVPESTGPTGAIVVFAAFEGPEDDAPTISSVAVVVVGGVRGLFDGPGEVELILRNIPFGDDDPPTQPMTVTAPGYKTVAQQLELRKDIATFVDLTMEAVDLAQTGTVQGSVRDSAGAPIVNALVTFAPVGGAAEDSVLGFTDGDGKFIIGGIPAGEVEVEAVAAEFLPEVQTVTIQPDQGGSNADLFFSLIGGQTTVNIKGVVKDLRAEEPLAGAEVTIADAPSVLTGADGRFEVPDILVGTRPIKVTLEGYDDYEDDLNVRPGMGDQTILMSRASGTPPTVPYTIAGTVTLLGKADSSGAVVTAFDVDRVAQMGSYTTAADGNYYLFVPAGRYDIQVTFGTKQITRRVDYAGDGRVIEGIDFTLTVTP